MSNETYFPRHSGEQSPTDDEQQLCDAIASVGMLERQLSAEKRAHEMTRERCAELETDRDRWKSREADAREGIRYAADALEARRLEVESLRRSQVAWAEKAAGAVPSLPVDHEADARFEKWLASQASGGVVPTAGGHASSGVPTAVFSGGHDPAVPVDAQGNGGGAAVLPCGCRCVCGCGAGPCELPLHHDGWHERGGTSWARAGESLESMRDLDDLVHRRTELVPSEPTPPTVTLPLETVEKVRAALELLKHRDTPDGPCWCLLWPDDEPCCERGKQCLSAREALALLSAPKSTEGR